jgi:hypothetical protein
MFTLIGIGLMVFGAFLVNRSHKKITGSTDTYYFRHMAHEITTVAWLLAVAVVMLGIIADRIH